MKTLALSGGDLVVDAGRLQMLEGPAKIRQDLALALGEEYNTDPFRPGWGSVLPQHIGEPITDDTPMLVQAEVNRVIQQYMANQKAILEAAYVNRQAHTINTSEIIRTVNSIDVSVQYDSVMILVSLTTMAGQTIQISRTVS